MMCEARVCACRCMTVLLTAFEAGLAALVLTSIASTALMSEEHVLGREFMTSLIFVSTTCTHLQACAPVSPEPSRVKGDIEKSCLQSARHCPAMHCL